MRGLADTPGPWDVFPNPDTGRVTIGPVESHSNLVREVALAYYDRPKDADLLAAAPELAETLIDLVETMGEIEEEEESPSLAKARDLVVRLREFRS